MALQPGSLPSRSSVQAPHFHGDCDVAAVVYGRDAAPDTLLAAFMHDLLGQGFDVFGVVQDRPAFCAGTTAEPFFRPISGEPGSRTETCRDRLATCGTALPDIGAWLAAGLRRRPDLVVLNRYGSQEMAGAGLIGVLAEAIERDVPVLIAVPEALFPRWLSLARGLAVRLAPDRSSLENWWHSLGKAGPGAMGATFCGRFK